MQEEAKDRGGLFHQDKRGPNSPDMTGSIVMSPELLMELNDLAANNKPIKVRLSCWNRTSKDGNTNYYSCKMRGPAPDQPQGGYNQAGYQSAPTTAPQQNYQPPQGNNPPPWQR